MNRLLNRLHHRAIHRFSVQTLLFAVVLLSTVPQAWAAEDEKTRPRNRFDTDILVETFGFDENTEGKVSYHELYQGCPARDCIPSIDKAKYVPAAEVDYLKDGDLVLALSINGDARAYPAKVLNHHEIVNEIIGGEPIAVTFCPLCGSGVAFDRRIDGEVVEFGVSGVLHDNDLVMYDRSSNTLWQQITGEAIMGKKLGQKLKTVPLTMTTWREWKRQHRKTKVLSLDTGFDGMDYQSERYGEYIASEQIYFPLGHSSAAMHPKTVVHGFDIDDFSFAVDEKQLSGKPQSLAMNGETFLIQRDKDGTVLAVRLKDGQRYTSLRLFWFAWYNFHPNTAIAKL